MFPALRGGAFEIVDAMLFNTPALSGEIISHHLLGSLFPAFSIAHIDYLFQSLLSTFSLFSRLMEGSKYKFLHPDAQGRISVCFFGLSRFMASVVWFCLFLQLGEFSWNCPLSRNMKTHACRWKRLSELCGIFLIRSR